MAAARRATSASSRPTQATKAELYTRSPASRPASAQASRAPAKSRALSSAEEKGTLNSAAWRAASRGVRFRPAPPTRIGMPPGCTGLGSAGDPASW